MNRRRFLALTAAAPVIAALPAMASTEYPLKEVSGDLYFDRPGAIRDMGVGAAFDRYRTGVDIHDFFPTAGGIDRSPNSYWRTAS